MKTVNVPRVLVSYPAEGNQAVSQQTQDHAYMECLRAIAALQNQLTALVQTRLRIAAGFCEIATGLRKEPPEWNADRLTVEKDMALFWELQAKHDAINAKLSERAAERDRYNVL